MSPWTTKLDSRLYFTSLLKEENAFKRDELQKKLSLELCLFLKNQTGVWGGYKALLWEADVQQAILESSHLQWVFPRIQGDELNFYKSQKFEKSALGFYEPVLLGAEFVHRDEIAGFLVPGLAFNAKGVRLGRGKGYYDRLLQNYNGKKVGVGYSNQFWSGELPSELHDINMNYVITNEQILLCS
ncbi:MAG TPA: 5-formyltetrahydrofolate cyclo-ligase [Pseudobdellovibrionaceae bacterium]|nr:5-formyltetrahydrofolate cyclo-ligase [Pseudobdellovibrionaceae bacterium]